MAKYKSRYIELIPGKILQTFFEDSAYRPYSGFTVDEFQATRLIRWKSEFEYKAGEAIVGSYNGIKIKQSNVRITHIERTVRHRHQHVDIDGTLTCFQYKAEIARRILLVGCKCTTEPDIRFMKMETEDEEFNKKFNLYAADAASVYCILTPDFMEYLKGLGKTAERLCLSYDGEQLCILRNTKGGVFKPPVLKKFDLQREMERSRVEIDRIIKIIELLQMHSENRG